MTVLVGALGALGALAGGVVVESNRLGIFGGANERTLSTITLTNR